MKIAKRRIDGIKQSYHIKSRQKGIVMGVLKFNFSDKLVHPSYINYPDDELRRADKVLRTYPQLINFYSFVGTFQEFFKMSKANDGRVIIYLPKNLIDILRKEQIFYVNDDYVFDNLGILLEVKPSNYLKIERDSKKFFKYYISRDFYDKCVLNDKDYHFKGRLKVFYNVGVLK